MTIMQQVDEQHSFNPCIKEIIDHLLKGKIMSLFQYRYTSVQVQGINCNAFENKSTKSLERNVLLTDLNIETKFYDVILQLNVVFLIHTLKLLTRFDLTWCELLNVSGLII